MTALRIGIINRKRRQRSFIADRRGAVSFEMILVYPFLVIGILLPMADIAIASYQYISAKQALHAFGQSLVYDPPDDLANTGTWVTETQGKADDLDYPITNIQLLCGDGGAVCSSANTASPKYYSFQTTVTLSPMVLSSVLCSSSCTYTLSYSARFQ